MGRATPTVPDARKGGCAAGRLRRDDFGRCASEDDPARRAGAHCAGIGSLSAHRWRTKARKHVLASLVSFFFFLLLFVCLPGTSRFLFFFVSVLLSLFVDHTMSSDQGVDTLVAYWFAVAV